MRLLSISQVIAALLVSTFAFRISAQIRVPTITTLREDLKRHPEKWKGAKGYKTISDEFFGSEMGAAYAKVSRVLTRTKFRRLNWGPEYRGTTESFHRECRILFPDGKLNPVYQGMNGLVRYAERFYKPNGDEATDMRRPFLNSLALLSRVQQRDLDWRYFDGTSSDYLHDQIFLLKNGKIKAEAKGVDGLTQFTETYDGDTQKARANALAVVGPSQFWELEWPDQFSDPPDVFRMALRARIAGRLRYEGTNGYLDFADEFFPIKAFEQDGQTRAGGDMNRAYLNALSALGTTEFEKLGWRDPFKGSTFEFSMERSRLLAALKAEMYIGEVGLTKYVNKFYSNREAIAVWANAKAVLTEEEFEKLAWSKPERSIPIRKRLFENEVVIEAFRGPSGYANFADKWYQGRMQLPFEDAMEQLAPADFKKLEWSRKFVGLSQDFQRLRSVLVFRNGQIKDKYSDVSGYARFATDHAHGRMSSAWYLARSVLTDSEFQRLGWRVIFSSTVSEWEAIRAFLTKPDGSMNFRRWYGSNTGLRDATMRYIKASGRKPPYPTTEVNKVRQLFRSALNTNEMESFGWTWKIADRGVSCRAFAEAASAKR